MLPYRIRVYQIYYGLDSTEWAWKVYSPTGEKLASGQAAWRWLAARRAQKCANKLHRNKTLGPEKEPRGDMDYDWYPDIEEGFARER